KLPKLGVELVSLDERTEGLVEQPTRILGYARSGSTDAIHARSPTTTPFPAPTCTRRAWYRSRSFFTTNDDAIDVGQAGGDGFWVGVPLSIDAENSFDRSLATFARSKLASQFIVADGKIVAGREGHRHLGRTA